MAREAVIKPIEFSCLAVETSTAEPGVAVLQGDASFLREAPGLRNPSRQVVSWARELLDEAGISPGALSCIAYGAGPGSFTGVRVAASMAQGLGYGWNVPVCPVSSLAAMAAAALRIATAAGRDTPDAVACAVDARMGEVYFGLYVADAILGVRSLATDALLAPGAVALPAGRRYLAAGSGWAVWPDLASRWQDRLGRLMPQLCPSALDVARLAAPRFAAGLGRAAVDALPNYLRDRVALAP